MKIRVRVLSELKEAIGKGTVDLDLKEGSNLQDVLEELAAKYDPQIEMKTGRKLNDVLPQFNIFVGGGVAKLPDDLRMKLKDGAEIAIIRPVGGG